MQAANSLLVIMRAASCNLAYTSAASWTGPQCMLESIIIGQEESATDGGQELPDFKDVLSGLVRGMRSHLLPSCPPPLSLVCLEAGSGGAESVSAVASCFCPFVFQIQSLGQRIEGFGL
jgi:hypothetical protein